MTGDRATDTAGAGSPAPAVSSVSPDAGRPGADVVPPEARVELDRVRRRWGELTLERAEAGMPELRRLLDHLTDRWADDPERTPLPPVHDLGPAVAVEQLTVVVWDAYATGRGDGIPQLLTDLRRALH